VQDWFVPQRKTAVSSPIMKLRIPIGFRAMACGLAALVMTAAAQAQTSISFKPFGSLNAMRSLLKD
jgi:hypothetical protein